MATINCMLSDCSWEARDASPLQALITHLCADHSLTEPGARNAIRTGGEVPEWAVAERSSGVRSMFRRPKAHDPVPAPASSGPVRLRAPSTATAPAG